MLRRAALSLAASLVLAPLASLASDGVLEINQECALSTGCFPGDAPGYPVTIRGFSLADPFAPIAPARSFRLTSDLGFLGSNDTAIHVNTNGATIDLGGFRILGPVQCGGAPVSCSPLGSGVGVLGGSDVIVKNGTITGMGDDGVRLDYSSRAEGLHVFHNGGDGISLGNESLARANVVTTNGADGIACRFNCGLHDNTSTGNVGDGIDVISGTVTGNSASLNAGFGGRFGPEVSFGLNQLTGNTSGDVNGGHAAAGNACFDGSCSRRGARRFYLTTTSMNGSQPLTACSLGFHFANLWELFDVAVLEYDTGEGFGSDDSGSGPPSGTEGWIRTGAASNGQIAPGFGNCNGWSSASASLGGTAVTLDSGWANGNPGFPTDNAPWIPIASECHHQNRVWCVED
jgi:Right handed beta helix region